jgi:hypothetical protein
VDGGEAGLCGLQLTAQGAFGEVQFGGNVDQPWVVGEALVQQALDCRNYLAIGAVLKSL